MYRILIWTILECISIILFATFQPWRAFLRQIQQFETHFTKQTRSMTFLWQLASCHEHCYTDNVMVYTYIPFRRIATIKSKIFKENEWFIIRTTNSESAHGINYFSSFFDNIIYTHHFYTMYMCKSLHISTVLNKWQLNMNLGLRIILNI